MREHLACRLRTALPVTVACFLLLACGSQPLLSNDAQEDARRIVEKLGAEAGSTLGEVGAGTGEVALAVAGELGTSGKLYATELDKAKLRTLRTRAAQAKGAAIEVRESLPDASNLPDNCCDGLYMRDVYHHFTEPEKLVASFYRNLKPGGRFVIIDFRPRTGGSWSTPEGVPANRGGHGIPIAVLRKELEAGGFRHVETIEQWRDNLFAVVVEKPR